MYCGTWLKEPAAVVVPPVDARKERGRRKAAGVPASFQHLLL
jgi:hypothetical protein